jgi:uncharacterized membrane protein
VGTVMILAVIVWLRPAPPSPAAQAAAAQPVTYAQLRTVLDQRCAMCHAEQVQMKNVRLDSPELVAQHAQNLYQQVVVTRQMPMNNSTNITEDERQLIKRWFEGGAPVK